MRKIITITIDAKLDEEFRELVKLEYGNKKGAYSKAIEEAIRKWIEERKEKILIKRVLEILDKGLEGEKWKFDRKEIYDFL